MLGRQAVSVSPERLVPPRGKPTGKAVLAVARALLGDWLLGDIIILAGPTAKKVRSSYDEDVILEQVLGLIHAVLQEHVVG